MLATIEGNPVSENPRPVLSLAEMVELAENSRQGFAAKKINSHRAWSEVNFNTAAGIGAGLRWNGRGPHCQSWDAYEYALNNPTTNTDPTGLQSGGAGCTIENFGASGCPGGPAAGATTLGWDPFELMGIPVVTQSYTPPSLLSSIDWSGLSNENGVAVSVGIFSPGGWTTTQVGTGLDLLGLYSNPGPLPAFGPGGPKPAPIPPSISAALPKWSAPPDTRPSCASVLWNGLGFAPTAAPEAVQQGAQAASVGARGAAWAYAASRGLTVPLRSPYFRALTNLGEDLAFGAEATPVLFAVPAFAMSDVATFEANRSRACRTVF